MERLLLARHAESEYSALGLVNGDPSLSVGLTEQGVRQARALGEALAAEAIDLCVVTEFLRTAQTADLALEGRDVPLLVVAGLNDPRYGAFEGRPLPEYRAWVTAHGSAEAVPGGGESRLEIVRRYVGGFRALLGRRERTILAVLHSLPLAYLFAALEGRHPAPRMELVALAEARSVGPEELEGGVARLEAWCRAPGW